MSEMVERVAKAIHFHVTKDDAIRFVWEELRDGQRNFFCEQARAAIAAMREPTNKMFGAVVEHGVCSYGAAETIWHGMIDEALKD